MISELGGHGTRQTLGPIVKSVFQLRLFGLNKGAATPPNTNFVRRRAASPVKARSSFQGAAWRQRLPGNGQILQIWNQTQINFTDNMDKQLAEFFLDVFVTTLLG